MVHHWCVACLNVFLTAKKFEFFLMIIVVFSFVNGYLSFIQKTIQCFFLLICRESLFIPVVSSLFYIHLSRLQIYYLFHLFLHGFIKIKNIFSCSVSCFSGLSKNILINSNYINVVYLIILFYIYCSLYLLK